MTLKYALKNPWNLSCSFSDLHIRFKTST